MEEDTFVNAQLIHGLLFRHLKLGLSFSVFCQNWSCNISFLICANFDFVLQVNKSTISYKLKKDSSYSFCRCFCTTLGRDGHIFCAAYRTFEKKFFEVVDAWAERLIRRTVICLRASSFNACLKSHQEEFCFFKALTTCFVCHRNLIID